MRRKRVFTENAKTLILLGEHESSQRFFRKKGSRKDTMSQPPERYRNAANSH